MAAQRTWRICRLASTACSFRIYIYFVAAAAFRHDRAAPTSVTCHQVHHRSLRYWTRGFMHVYAQGAQLFACCSSKHRTTIHSQATSCPPPSLLLPILHVYPLQISVQCPLEQSASGADFVSVLVVRPLLGDFHGNFNASFQFCACDLDGSKLEQGGRCWYTVTNARGDLTQQKSKVSHRSTFSLSANSASHITFSCAQACVVSVLVSSASQAALPVLDMQARVFASNSQIIFNSQIRRHHRQKPTLKKPHHLPPRPHLPRLHLLSRHGTCSS